MWASPADLFLPGRQRGLEGGEPARGNSWERRRLGLVSRGSLFPSELMGLEDEPEPRQSSQASTGLQWFGTPVSRSGRGDEQGLQILERNPFPASVNCPRGRGIHLSAPEGKNRSRTLHVSQRHFFRGLFLETFGGWAQPREVGNRKPPHSGWVALLSRGLHPLPAELLFLSSQFL